MDRDLLILSWYNKGANLDRRLSSAESPDEYFAVVSEYYRVIDDFWGGMENSFRDVTSLAEHLNSYFGLRVQVEPRKYDVELQTSARIGNFYIGGVEGLGGNVATANLIRINKDYFVRQDFSSFKLTLEALIGMDFGVCQSTLFKNQAYEILFFMTNLKYAVECGYEGDWYEKGLQRMKDIGWLSVAEEREDKSSLDVELRGNLAELGISWDEESLDSLDEEEILVLEGDLRNQYSQLKKKVIKELMGEGEESIMFTTNFGKVLVTAEEILGKERGWAAYFSQLVPLAEGNEDIVSFRKNKDRDYHREFVIDVISSLRESYCVKRVKELDETEWGVWFGREKFKRAYDAGKSFFWRVFENLGLEDLVYSPRAFEPFVFEGEVVYVQEEVGGKPFYQGEFDLRKIVKGVALMHYLGNAMKGVWRTQLFDLRVRKEVDGIIDVVFDGDEELRRVSSSLVEYLELRELEFAVPVHGALHPDNIHFDGQRHIFLDMDNFGRALPSLDLMKLLEDGRIGLDNEGIIKQLALYYGIVGELDRGLLGRKPKDYFDFEEGTEIIKGVFEGPDIHLLSDEERRTYSLHTVFPLCWAAWKLSGERAQVLARRAVSNAREFEEVQLAEVLSQRFNL